MAHRKPSPRAAAKRIVNMLADLQPTKPAMARAAKRAALIEGTCRDITAPDVAAPSSRPKKTRAEYSEAFKANIGRGRKKGSKNIHTYEAKEMIAQCFNKIGGLEAFAAWARINKTEFYRHYAKLVPVKLAGVGKDGLIEILISRDDANL